MKRRTIERLENGNILIQIPTLFRTERNRRTITPAQIPRNDALILAIARGRRWQRYIDEGNFSNVDNLARYLGKDPSKVATVLRFARLAPAVIHRLIAGKYTQSISMAKLAKNLPELWSEQYMYIFGEPLPEG